MSGKEVGKAKTDELLKQGEAVFQAQEAKLKCKQIEMQGEIDAVVKQLKKSEVAMKSQMLEYVAYIEAMVSDKISLQIELGLQHLLIKVQEAKTVRKEKNERELQESQEQARLGELGTFLTLDSYSQKESEAVYLNLSEIDPSDSYVKKTELETAMGTDYIEGSFEIMDKHGRGRILWGAWVDWIGKQRAIREEEQEGMGDDWLVHIFHVIRQGSQKEQVRREELQKLKLEAAEVQSLLGRFEMVVAKQVESNEVENEKQRAENIWQKTKLSLASKLAPFKEKMRQDKELARKKVKNHEPNPRSSGIPLAEIAELCQSQSPKVVLQHLEVAKTMSSGEEKERHLQMLAEAEVQALIDVVREESLSRVQFEKPQRPRTSRLPYQDPASTTDRLSS